ncbi:MAG: hypothetical protein EU550_03100, partial [Promethearchaeota archaeon]
MAEINNIYDIYEPEYFSDLSALTNLGKRISGKRDIKIDFRNSAYIYTDGLYIILPDKFKKEIEIAQGFIAHEAGHIGYGSFEISFIKLIKVLSQKHSLPKTLVKKLLNVIEDVRINLINREKFPGFYRNLRNYTLDLMPQIKKKMKKTGDILLYINLFMENYPDFLKKPKFRSREMLDEDWRNIELSKRLLKKTLAPNVSILVADQICKTLKKYYIKKKIVYRRSSQNNSKQSSSYRIDKRLTRENEEMILIDPENPPIKDKGIENKIDDLESDEMEDPFYFENDQKIPPIFSPEEFETPFITQDEEFIQKVPSKEKSKLEEANESTIEKIKNSDLTSKDLEEILNKIEKTKDMVFNEKDLLDEMEEKSKTLSEINKIMEKAEENEYKRKISDKDILPSKKIAGIDNRNNLDQKENTIIEDVVELIEKGERELKERFVVLENYDSINRSNKVALSRKVVETRIEDDGLKPIGLKCFEIKSEHRILINRMKKIFEGLNSKCTDIDNFQKKGRLNNKFIKAITSEFTFTKCFSRKIKSKILKILVLVDISGSMSNG